MIFVSDFTNRMCPFDGPGPLGFYSETTSTGWTWFPELPPAQPLGCT
jgi:hypothetical protein